MFYLAFNVAFNDECSTQVAVDTCVVLLVTYDSSPSGAENVHVL